MSLASVSKELTKNLDVIHHITEVIIPHQQHSAVITLPLIATYSHQATEERWITWITATKPSKEQLLSVDTQIERLRIIHIKSNSDNRWLIWEALNTGNSYAVIADYDGMNQQDLIAMENAAVQGKCTGVFIRHGLSKSS